MGGGSEAWGRGEAAAAIGLAAIRSSRCSFLEAKELGLAAGESALGVRRVETSCIKSLLEEEAEVVGVMAARSREVEGGEVAEVSSGAGAGAGTGAGVGAGGGAEGDMTWSSAQHRVSSPPPPSRRAGLTS